MTDDDVERTIARLTSELQAASDGLPVSGPPTPNWQAVGGVDPAPFAPIDGSANDPTPPGPYRQPPSLDIPKPTAPKALWLIPAAAVIALIVGFAWWLVAGSNDGDNVIADDDTIQHSDTNIFADHATSSGGIWRLPTFTSDYTITSVYIDHSDSTNTRVWVDNLDNPTAWITIINDVAVSPPSARQMSGADPTVVDGVRIYQDVQTENGVLPEANWLVTMADSDTNQGQQYLIGYQGLDREVVTDLALKVWNEGQRLDRAGSINNEAFDELVHATTMLDPGMPDLPFTTIRVVMGHDGGSGSGQMVSAELNHVGLSRAVTMLAIKIGHSNQLIQIGEALAGGATPPTFYNDGFSYPMMLPPPAGETEWMSAVTEDGVAIAPDQRVNDSDEPWDMTRDEQIDLINQFQPLTEDEFYQYLKDRDIPFNE